MPKNIVICSDGTGNTAVKDRGTNVFKLFEAVDLRGNPPQIAFYDDGVGTEQFKLIKMLGGAFGYGLSRNVRELYTHLARVYDPGDRLFFFGFSRGAYTVRTLAGMVAQMGIVDRAKVHSDAELKALVSRAYSEDRHCFRNYFQKRSGKPVDDKAADAFRRAHSVQHEIHAPDGRVTIEFIGVWDTVDAVGFPWDFMADFWNEFIFPFKFPDTLLGSQVNRACHVVALDDERATFHPVLWDGKSEAPDRMEQVWFAGVHSNVGGGYPKQGMSLVTLVWMMEHAEQSGLRFLPSVRQLYSELQNVNDKLYDSRSGAATYYRYKPRPVVELCRRSNIRPHVHVSAIERIALGTDGYAPGNLSGGIEVVADESSALAEALTRVICTECEEHKAHLDQAGFWIKLKQAAQVALVLATNALWLYAVVVLAGAIPFSAAAPALIAAAMVACVGVSILSTGRMQRIYSEFWFRLRPTLRKMLLERANTAAM